MRKHVAYRIPWRHLLLLVALLALSASLHPQTPNARAAGIATPIVSNSIRNGTSRPLRLLPARHSPDGAERPLRSLPATTAQADTGAQTFLSAAQNQADSPAMPAPLRNFAGINGPGFILPPDPTGDVGLEHYVQWVNNDFAIWKKDGTLVYGPTDGNTLWSDLGGICAARNDGDPIVLYDQLAGRWLMSQFAVNPDDYHQCIAISRTEDPTGEWHLYDFLISTTKLNDYAKFGIWPDGYYMSVNQYTGPGEQTWGGAGVVAFEREKMLQGQPAAMVYFDLYTVDPYLGGMLPADLDGATPPPANAPNYFVEVDNNNPVVTFDRLQIFRFDVDWNTPASSTFSGPQLIDLTAAGHPFTPAICADRFCIDQPDAAPKLDSITDRLMYRLAYRNFGNHQALVMNHTVNINGHAGIRWYEVRDPSGTPTLHQAGDFAPDSAHRWMGSIAMDKDGNIAVGYSVSSTTIYPSIRYAGRLADDPLGTLAQGEAVLIAGGGAQTSFAKRWGDYSTITTDPTDDCTFWYTQEYYAATSDSNWQTRIGAFKFPSCGQPKTGELRGTVRDAQDNQPIADAQIIVNSVSAVSNAEGRYEIANLPVGDYTATITKTGYISKTIDTITILRDTEVILDIELTKIPLAPPARLLYIPAILR